jgi:phosphate starvation-inducible PhoH-like protein
MAETTLTVSDTTALLNMFGPRDQHVRAVRTALGVSISARDGEVRIQGDEAAVAKAADILQRIHDRARRKPVSADEVAAMLSEYEYTRGGSADAEGDVQVMNAGRRIVPRSPGQAAYIEAIRKHDLVFCVGPAGTGKTYLAVAMAVNALKQELIRKIVLVRPAVEAGESLGFLPGDLQAKINPYLRPLLDALREMMDYDHMKRYMERDLIEVIPLAYMRGRSLNEAFIILDEAQNTTVTQMKMFLTRMGHGSRIVVSGDATQVDLPPHTKSGLTDALERLKNIPGICQVTMGTEDIVRNPLVHKIVLAYEQGAAGGH